MIRVIDFPIDVKQNEMQVALNHEEAQGWHIITAYPLLVPGKGVACQRVLLRKSIDIPTRVVVYDPADNAQVKNVTQKAKAPRRKTTKQNG